MNSSIAQTGTGAHIDVLAPRAADIHIFDIARALSRTARWNGWTNTALTSSVAEHSVRVSWLCDTFCPEYALWGLLHDAAEAYTGDCITPLKRQLPDFRTVEEAIERAVAERFDLPWPMPQVVKDMDALALAWEGRDHMTPPVRTAQSENLFFINGKGRETLPEPWHETQAQKMFLGRFAELAGDPLPPSAAA